MPLAFPSLLHTGADHVAPLPALRPQQLLLGESRDPQAEIDPVEQRTGQLLLIQLHPVRPTATVLALIAVEPAGARVGRGDQREPRRELDRARSAGHHDATVLERLPQTFERVAPELRELVQEEHPVMRQAHLSRAQERRPAAEETGDRHRVMRARGTAAS